MTLNCSASGGGDVTYTWYRGGKRIPTPRSPFRLEEQIDVEGPHIYTCNVSNPISWANQSLPIGQGCGSALQSECSAWGWARVEGAGPSPGSGAGDGGPPGPLGLQPFARVLASGHTGPGQPGLKLGRILSPSRTSWKTASSFPQEMPCCLSSASCSF